MDKIFVIVWHVFMGSHAGEPTQWMPHAFSDESICRSFITETMKWADRDKEIHRNFYVDCMNFSDLPEGLPTYK